MANVVRQLEAVYIRMKKRLMSQVIKSPRRITLTLRITLWTTLSAALLEAPSMRDCTELKENKRLKKNQLMSTNSWRALLRWLNAAM